MVTAISIPGPVKSILGDIGSIGSGGAPNATTIQQSAELGPAVSDVTNDAGAVASFLAKLGTRNLWIRIAKVVSGIALILMGAGQLAHVSKLAGTAAKAAVLA